MFGSRRGALRRSSLGAILLLVGGTSCTAEDTQATQQPAAELEMKVEALNGVTGSWVARGPGPELNGGHTSTPGQSNPVIGAIRDIVAHPTDAKTMYVASVNGGIWRTNNATAAAPTWTPLTDGQASLSIGALRMDPTNTNQLLAGIGQFSSFSGAGGPSNGLLLSTNGGTSWTPISVAPLSGRRMTSVAISGNVLLAASSGGLFRSPDLGVTWTTISGAAASKLPAGALFDLVNDPSTAGRYYAVIQRTGVFRSDDFGATWTNVTNGGLTAAIQAAGNDNARVAVGNDGRAYVIVTRNRQSVYIGTSANQGGAWTAMDLVRVLNTANTPHPSISGASNTSPIVITTSAAHKLPCPNEFPINVRISGVLGNAAANGDFQVSCIATPMMGFSTTTFSLNGSTGSGNYTSGGSFQIWDGLHTEGQGDLHLALAVDPTNSSIVYVAGDAAPGQVGDGASIWRGNSATPANNAIPSAQWAHLQGSNAYAPIPAGGTASGSAPHPDGRRIVFDASGNMLFANDGGIYLRTSPRDNSGDWFSRNGDLQISEIHHIAFDPVSRIIMGGAQDNGTPTQSATNSLSWSDASGRDGGDVTVDALASPGNSVRYTSAEFLQGFTRTTFNGANAQLAQSGVKLQIPTNPMTGCVAKDPSLDLVNLAQFYTPIEANRFAGSRLVIAAKDSVYESSNAGDCVVSLGAAGGANHMAYGAGDNADALYVANGAGVFVRTAAGGALTASAAFTAGNANDVVMKPSAYKSAYVVTDSQVFSTSDAGTTWTNITGDLTKLATFGNLHAITYVPGPKDDRIVVAGDSGVFMTSTASAGFWNRLGTNLPAALAFDLDYDATSDTLVVATLGRGGWSFNGVSAVHLPPVAKCQVQVKKNADSTCHAAVTPAEVDNGSYGPDGNAVTLSSISPADPFTRGTASTKLTVTDATGASETCSTKIIVTDATPPTFASTNPTTVEIVACQPNSNVVTLTAPTVTDICGCLTLSGAVTAVDGVSASIPLKQVTATTYQAAVPTGALTVQWKATNCDGVASAPFIQTVTVLSAPALYARQSINIDSLASVVTSAGDGATVNNGGVVPLGITSLALGAKAGRVLSVPGVTLTGSDTGSVVSGGPVINIGATVHGTVQQSTTPKLPPFPPLSVTYPFNLNEVIVLPLFTKTLQPGSYDNVVVTPGGKLHLGPGTYLFNTLNIDPAATLEVDVSSGPVNVYVQTEITHMGAVAINGPANQFVLGYTGIVPVLLLTSFTGVVIAPNALLTLSLPLFGTYTGAFYAQDISVAAAVKVVESPFACH
ncbi:MAG: sodium/calcium exchanger 1 [Myxococcaceae bacterium]|nr:sodium/calcium exchanger 1 [Myxococcaceae bacterium]